MSIRVVLGGVLLGCAACLVGWVLVHSPTPNAPSVPAASAEDAAGIIEGPGSEATSVDASESRTPATAASGDDAAMPLARSPAMPSLTLVGHLEERVRRLPWGDGHDYERQVSRGKDVASAVRSARYNPKRKELSAEQYEILGKVIERHSEKIAPATIEEGRQRKEAALQALRSGSYESIEVRPARNPFNPAEWKGAAKETQGSVAEMTERAQRRLGRLGQDFIYSTMGSFEPDNVSRETMVIITRAAQPRYFDALDTQRRLEKERDAEIIQFFQGL